MTRRIPPPVRYHRFAAALCAALTGTLAALAVHADPAGADTYKPTPVPATADAVTAVNYFRAMAGVAPVTANPALTPAAANHSCYMLHNGISHGENPALPGYTAAGDAAGSRGNVAVSSGTTSSERDWVELWMTGPFHALGILRPGLTSVGFGGCTLTDTPKWHQGATLEIMSGLTTRPRPAAPVVWPGDGTTTRLNRFVAETPNPLTMCGWSSGGGLPVLALLPEPPVVTSATMTGPTGPLETCALSAGNVTDPTGRALLAGDNAVTVVPRNPLTDGTYQVTIVTTARTVTWTFHVDHTMPDPTPVAVTPAGDTSVIGPVGGLAPIVPFRAVDTRDQLGASRLAAMEVQRVQIAGHGGVPPDATAVSANVTTVGATGPGFLTVYPCTATVPLVSTVNFTGPRPVANAAIVPLDATGGVCLYANTASDVVVDVNGYAATAATGGYVPVTPTRILDTRAGFGSPGRLRTRQQIEVRVAGNGAGVPADAAGVVINVVAVNPSGDGYVTAWPCSADRPLVSNLNVGSGEIRANTAVVAVSTTGSICLYSYTDVDLVADLTGYVTATTGGLRYVPLAPTRLVDTREPGGLLQAGTGGAPAAAGSTTVVHVAGRRGVPAEARGVSLNIAATGSVGDGFVTVWSCSEPRPVVSALNTSHLGAVADGAQAEVDADGDVCVYTNVTAHLIIDIAGAWTP